MTRASYTDNRGSALVMALAVLGILLAMGFAMYNFVDLESRSMTVDFHADRALWVARSGVEQAIGELQSAVAAGKTGDLLKGPLEVEVPVYKLAGRDLNAAQLAPVVDDRYSSKASVTISDESARLNVNFAPPAVLMSILKIDGEKARQLRERLPRLDGSSAGNEGRRWLSSVEELMGQQVVPAEALTKERMADLTTFTALDMQNPSGFVNVNAASSAVLEAALGVTPEVAAKVIAARPLNSIEAVAAAAGKDAASFTMQKELAFSSRCYRIVSTARLAKADSGVAVASFTVEAVAQFPDNAPPRIVYWSEGPTAARAGN